MTFAIMFVMPAPHRLSSSWLVSYFCSLSCIHVNIPRHCGSSQAACASSRFVRCRMVWCGCVSSFGCCRIVLSKGHLQSLGAMAVARALRLLLRFSLSFLTIGSTMVAPVVFPVMGVAVVAISIAIATGTLLLRSPGSPVYRLLLPLSLASAITPVLQTSLSRVVLIVTCWLAEALCNHLLWGDFTRLHSIESAGVCALFRWSCRCCDARYGVKSTS